MAAPTAYKIPPRVIPMLIAAIPILLKTDCADAAASTRSLANIGYENPTNTIIMIHAMLLIYPYVPLLFFGK